MKVLIDENLPQDLRLLIAGHDVFTVGFLGWKGLKNGELLRRAQENGFEALITNDAGLEHQQNRSNLPLTIIHVAAASNAMEVILPKVHRIQLALDTAHPRSFVRVD